MPPPKLEPLFELSQARNWSGLVGWSGAGKRSLKLDRETEALLHWVSSATVTPLWSLTPAAARDEYRRTLAKTEIVRRS
jgi:hypothetical protein